MSAKKILICGFLSVGLLIGVSVANAAYDTDGSMFPGKGCPTCTTQRKSDQKVQVIDGTKKRHCSSCNFKTKNYEFAQPRYKSSLRNCCDLAPFALGNVDFKLQNDGTKNHVGNYRFRIFGCRRASKKAILNQGRVIQKEMEFQSVFRKSVDQCYKVMEIPNVCLANSTVALPEYVLSAEITDFFMNICDEYDWEKAQKNHRRDGSAEMTVTWRLMDLTQSKVYWTGVTSGYADLEEGLYEGEVKLAEDAFGDAAARLNSLPGFEAQLKNHLSPQEKAKARAALIEFDARFHPEKCPVRVQTPCGRPSCPMQMQQPICPCANVQPACVCNQPTCSCPAVSCPCAAQQIQAQPKVEEFVDVKTKKKIIEQKIITKTRVETPAPVCQQVCQPVCPQPTCQIQCTKTCHPSNCRRICKEVCDESTSKCETKCYQDCGQPVEPKVEVLTYVPTVEEKGEVDVKNVVVEPQIEETGGVTDTHRVYENCVDETGNVVNGDKCDKCMDWENYTLDCVIDRDPYEELSPENMLVIRKSVVDIVNSFGKQSSGLLISDSFVITSADVVNKLSNSYTVKSISGDVLKAKAVRVNPAKNIALLHLDTPLSYTPLAFNTKLPAIDQEGFISLGQLSNSDTAKNYMDDNGKIYGYRYSDALGSEIIVDTLVNKVVSGSVLVDKLGTVNGMSNAAQQTKEGMDLFLPTETVLKGLCLRICDRVYKPVTEQIKQETKAPEAMPQKKRK